MSTEENVPLTEPDEQYKYVVRGPRLDYRRAKDRSALLFLLKMLTLVAIGTFFYVVTQALLTSRASWAHTSSVILPSAIVMAMAILGTLLLFTTGVVVIVFLGLFVWCSVILLQSSAISSDGAMLLLKLFVGSLVASLITTAYLALFYWP